MFDKERTPREEIQRFRETLNWLLTEKQISSDTYEQLIARDTPVPVPYYAWIGINPSGDTMVSLHLSASALPYENYIYCVEQNTDNGTRPHLHILAEVSFSTRPNKEISRLSKIFNCDPNFIEFKISKSKMLKNARLKYIRGEKTEGKVINVEKDIKDREILGLQNYYLIGNI